LQSVRLRVEWLAISGAHVASLVGTIDETAVEQFVDIRDASQAAPRLVVDLSRVAAVDEHGIALLEELLLVPNVGIVNVSDAVQVQLERLGRFGF